MKNNKGFSLIELMVVVAIIGVLSAIGVPQYTKFQAKARTSEAKATLGAIYTAETSFFTEWSQFSADMASIGMAVTGTGLRYTAGFNAVCGTTLPTPPELATRLQIHKTLVNTGTIPANFNTVIVPAAGTDAVLNGPSCTVGSLFTASATGDPRPNFAAISASSDTWTITQSKVLSNTVGGL